MNISLNNVEKICVPAIGGLKKIEIIDPFDTINSSIIQFFEPLIANVPLYLGKQPYFISHERNSASYIDKTVIARGGDYFESSVNLVAKKIRLDAERLVEKLRNRRVHLIVTHQNGSRRFCPMMRCQVETMSGDARSSLEVYKFQFFNKREKKNPLLSGPTNGGTVELGGIYHIFFQDMNGIWRHLTVDNDGTLVTTIANPNDYNNVVLIAPPFGISLNAVGSLITS